MKLPMNPNLQQVLQQLKQLPIMSPKYCDNCGNHHEEPDFQVIGYQEGVVLFQISCRYCGVVYLLRVNPAAAGIAIQRLETLNSDISATEFHKFAGKPQVRKDEALDIYSDMKEVKTIDEFLELFEGSEISTD
jgi:hypothetical protein